MDTDPGFFSALWAKVEKSNRLFTGNFGRAALCVAALAVGLASGCGSGGTTTSGGGGFSGGNALMKVVASSAANDQLTRFSLTLNSLTLTEKSGTSVSVVSGPQQVEFMHLNGGAEPLPTVSVPQGVYTAATATVGAASFTCAVQQQGSDTTSTYAYGSTPNSQVTVNLPQALTVSGDTMAVSLELLVSQSASFPSDCYEQGAQYSITPTFSLAAMTVAAPATNATNGKMTALEGLVLSAGGEPNGFTVAAADGTPVGSTMQTTWRVSTNASTVFQGIGNAEGLTAGMPVDMDGMLQTDGSVLATRVAVPDANTSTLTVNSGPLDQVTASVSILSEVNQEAEGSQIYISGWPVFNFSNTTFATWGGLTNVPSLPFAASFYAGNMVPGQMVAITTHATQAAVSDGGAGDGGDADAADDQRHGGSGGNGGRVYDLHGGAGAVRFVPAVCGAGRRADAADESADGRGVRGHEYAGGRGGGAVGRERGAVHGRDLQRQRDAADGLHTGVGRSGGVGGRAQALRVASWGVCRGS